MASAGATVWASARVSALPATGARTPALADRPALLGGAPIRTAPFPSWPVVDELEERRLMAVLRGGRWFRGYGDQVETFERAYADLLGAKYCVATANGTGALTASLGALDIGPGDEVILPPYTFVATLNVILLHHALPVFVDSDLETFQIDAKRIERAITDRTAAIIPVHLGGGAADLDTILEVAKRRGLPVVEDACQSHLAEWRGRPVGTWGTTGCFSFQASKNLNSGEGGAILTGDPEVAARCYGFHNNGRAHGIAGYNFSYTGGRSANLRLTEFQAALLLAQMTRLEAQSRTRDANARHLTGLLQGIAGIEPAKEVPGCTRNAWHLYMFRYDSERFDGLSRAQFMRALRAEGIPCSAGYAPLNKEAFITETLNSKAYRRVYPAEVLASWTERNACPMNDRLCAQAVWLTQPMLLGEKADMEDIAAAIGRIQAHSGELRVEDSASGGPRAGLGQGPGPAGWARA
jgi:dTDP-4-amino-4,6-dideoxygalactose transaminase